MGSGAPLQFSESFNLDRAHSSRSSQRHYLRIQVSGALGERILLTCRRWLIRFASTVCFVRHGPALLASVHLIDDGEAIAWGDGDQTWRPPASRGWQKRQCQLMTFAGFYTKKPDARFGCRSCLGSQQTTN
jgi:hypothetical protein